jgi:hypothetical protein
MGYALLSRSSRPRARGVAPILTTALPVIMPPAEQIWPFPAEATLAVSRRPGLPARCRFAPRKGG